MLGLPRRETLSLRENEARAVGARSRFGLGVSDATDSRGLQAFIGFSSLLLCVAVRLRSATSLVRAPAYLP